MKSHTFRGLAMILLLLAATPVSAETTKCTAITSLPYNITKQGAYCFLRSLTFKEDSGLVISVNANNVTIDLNGHTLSGLAGGPTTSAHGIYAANRQNITIRNGAIRGFARGIYLINTGSSDISQRHLIEDVEISKCIQFGIDIRGKNNIIRNSQVFDTGASSVAESIGITFAGSGGRLINNDIVRTRSLPDLRSTGLLVQVSPGTVIENNRIDSVFGGANLTFGIRIRNSDNVLVSGNRVSNMEKGIHFNSASANGKYMDNLTSDVAKPFTGGTPVGTND